MDQELVLFLEAAGPTVVAALATDAYQKVKDAVVSAWQRLMPFGAEAVGAELEATRTQVMAAREQGSAQAEQDLAERWQSQLHSLLSANPAIAEELRQALVEAGAVLPTGEQTTIGSIRMHATASDNGRTYQAGRDQHITEHTTQR
jgi:hypothetical protein